MNLQHFGAALTVLLALGCAAVPHRASHHVKEEFVGSTPCGPLSREFIGGLPAEAPCHCITWRLTLFSGGDSGNPATYQLVATYGVPPPGDPNQLVDGPTVKTEGSWTLTEGARSNPLAKVYSIQNREKQRVLSLARVSEHLAHFLNEDKSLRIGNAGWSFTLNRSNPNREK
jgi:hypothetical protein